MATSLVERFSATFSGPWIGRLPRLGGYNVDPIESAGSLLLIDPTHPSQPWGSGVPTDQTLVPNVLASISSSLTGSSDGAPFSVMNMAAPRGLAERSARGGLHAIYSNTNTDNITTGNSCYAFMAFPDSVADYVASNYSSHDFYVSVWSYGTRNGPGSYGNIYASVASTSSATSNLKVLFDQANTQTQVGVFTADSPGNVHIERSVGGLPTGPKLNAARTTTGYKGTIVPTDRNNLLDYAFLVGNHGPVNSYSTAKENVTSRVFYRTYVEDLTVSGRTFDEVFAIDQDLYTSEVLTEGGRYYGDTFTDPVTIP